MSKSRGRLLGNLFLILVILQITNAVYRHFLAHFGFDNRKSNNELSEYNAASLPFCLALCGVNCLCFGFNSKVKKCQIHIPCVRSDITVNDHGWRHYFMDEPLPHVDCKNLYKNGYIRSGVYQIYPSESSSPRSVDVYCDMRTNGGGWTAIQRRVDGSVNFNGTWAVYKEGFGNPKGSHWIGNELIHYLTMDENHSLYLSITLTNGTTLYKYYHQFSISDETAKYRLNLAGPISGTLGNSMLNSYYPPYYDAAGMAFSTPDMDNDGWTTGSCAAKYNGSWWFNFCHTAFLNGPWSSEDWTYPWWPVVMDGTNVQETIMMIKRH